MINVVSNIILNVCSVFIIVLVIVIFVNILVI